MFPIRVHSRVPTAQTIAAHMTNQATLETVLDRFAIIDVVNGVARWADQRRWDEVRNCFDATVGMEH